MTRGLIIALAATCIAAPAWACGPDFPEALLDSRAATLSQLPAGVFTEEAAHLVPMPAGGFKPVERADWFYTEPPPARDAVEREFLGDEFERAASIRQLASAKIAYKTSDGLPEDARRYLAGAVAFEHGDLAEAAQRFASVLALPVGERTRYGVWAAYMLGRTRAQASDASGAMQAFQQVRSLVAAGAADPLGLAVDSYGDEARLDLEAGNDGAAIALYAQQTALGSRFGQASLLQVARAIVGDPARLARGIDDAMTQELIALYLTTRSGELESDPIDADDASAPAAAGVIATFLDAMKKRGLDHVEGAGRLAALAYRSGRYDLAEHLAVKDSDGLSAWVRAKLALRAGDADAAATAYAQAAKAFPATDVVETSYEEFDEPARSYCRVEGEAGTLALARGEYVEALEHLYAAAPTFWPDAAFVAERVLTLDELKAFVAHRAAQAVKAAQPGTAVADSDRRAGFLRALFARRLLRAERYDEAISYFDDAELKKKAADYAAARRAAESGGRIERAQQWFSAALLARNDGMNLLGFELEPDDAFFDGNFTGMYSFGYGPPVEDVPPASVPTPLKVDAGPSAGERQRVSETVAKPDSRFHYRYVAADFASRAAELVPHRSQAYAAMLCQATGWLMYRDPDEARALYERYVRNGPYVPWAANFGTRCEEPDFDGAAKRLSAERIAAAKRFAREAFPYAFVVGAASLIAIVLWRRRRVRNVG